MTMNLFSIPMKSKIATVMPNIVHLHPARKNRTPLNHNNQHLAQYYKLQKDNPPRVMMQMLLAFPT
ncbi:hypothetical protein J3R74_000315 [Puniceicoccus vermicola]